MTLKIFDKIAAVLSKKRSRRCALSRAKRTSATPLEVKIFDKNSSLLFPENGNDDDVFLPSTDVPMTEFSPKRTLRSSRSTDAKTSETPVVDDVTQPPPNSSPGEPQQQQQQQRVYKKANKRVNKKVKRES